MKIENERYNLYSSDATVKLEDFAELLTREIKK